jgi:hypothetical protein
MSTSKFFRNLSQIDWWKSNCRQKGTEPENVNGVKKFIGRIKIQP